MYIFTRGVRCMGEPDQNIYIYIQYKYAGSPEGTRWMSYEAMHEGQECSKHQWYCMSGNGMTFPAPGILRIPEYSRMRCLINGGLGLRTPPP